MYRFIVDVIHVKRLRVVEKNFSEMTYERVKAENEQREETTYLQHR